LPAAVSLHQQGANKGAVVAFLIATPESGVDSISVTYALLDPVMTVVRPVAAFFTAVMAGIGTNLFSAEPAKPSVMPNLSCPVDGCCDGVGCPPEKHRRHHTLMEKVTVGIRYAFSQFWGDLAGWFFAGLLLAGLISALIPEDVFSRYLGGGLFAMLLMLMAGIPLYMCATASTPIAAALILKGVSPGAALVFLLAGPATNMASMTVLTGMLGKRVVAVYLGAIAVSAVLFGLLTDQIYLILKIHAGAAAGQSNESPLLWLAVISTIILLLLSVKPLYQSIQKYVRAGGRLGRKLKEKAAQKQKPPFIKKEACEPG
jgi:uncharacterized membrane protein YraQ (UPF0718 family)